MPLNIETTLITGASGGIGYELAKLFARDKFELVLVAEDEPGLEYAADQCRLLGSPRVITIVTDLSQAGAAFELYETVNSRGLEIMNLVNNAGIGEHGLFSETDIAKEDRIMQLNIVSLVHLTKYFLKGMLLRNEGRILNVGSVASYQPTPQMAVYAATKAFILSFSDALIYELKDRNITVTVLLPGPTKTDFFRKAHMEHTKAAKNKPDEAAKVAMAGYKGLMDGKHHVKPGIKAKSQVAMSVAMPNEAVSAMAAMQQEEKRKI